MSAKPWLNPRKLEDRLLARRKVEDDHWLWEGQKDKDGYGLIKYKYRPLFVHRASAMLYLGYTLSKVKDKDYQINHECNIKHCFNPRHLYIGSQANNIQDIQGKERK